jgi:aspartokinase/homoserine dehydrogenase 1
MWQSDGKCDHTRILLPPATHPPFVLCLYQQVPEPLRACKTAEEYMSRLPEFDADMAAKLEAARASGEVLRYVGVVDVKAGKGSVELRR